MSGRAGPLSGYQVIELAAIGPGPYAGQLLADYGADVIVVHGMGLFVAGLFEIGLDDFASISVGVVAGFAHQGRSPKPEQFVAPGFGLELHFGIMRIFGFKGVFAIIECGHGCGPFS